jgi:hypothetical protein
MVCWYSDSPTTPVLRGWTLVVPTQEARKDGRGQHVPEDLHVVRSHLLVSFLLGRPLWWAAASLAYGDHRKGGALAER